MDIRKILVPTDFSETAKLAAQHAMAVAGLFGAEVTLFHARTIFHDAPLAAEGEPDPVETDLKSLAQRLGENGGRSPAVSIHVARDVSAGEAILGLLADSDFDLVVMGTHGRSGLAHFVLGSVAEEVVRQAPCPVVTLRPAGRTCEQVYQKILVGFDFSTHSKEAVRFAGRLALESRARVDVLYVFEQQIHPAYVAIWEEMAVKMLPEVEQDARKAVAEILEEVGCREWGLQVVQARKRASAEIADFAAARDADLIVLGTHGFSGLDHLLLGSTSERVMRTAPCPVLTLKVRDSAEDTDGKEPSGSSGA